MALTRSKPASIFTPEGNSLAVFIDVADGTLKLKDVFGDVELFSNFSGGGGLNLKDDVVISATLTEVVDKDNTPSILSISTGSVGIGTNTSTGLLNLFKPSDTVRLMINGDAGQFKIITFRTGGLQRFGLYVNNTAESGANAGSDFAIRAYSDAGTLLSTPLFIKRSTGNIGINTSTPAKILDVNGDALVNGLTIGRGTGNIDTNTALGKNALNVNNTGSVNVAVGQSALLANTTGSSNSAVGVGALQANTIGIYNSAFGLDSLLSNTDGGSNTALGMEALKLNVGGDNNVGVGFGALRNNISANNNTAIGLDALGNNTTGTSNTAIGFSTGLGLTTGSNNTILGANVTGLSPTLANNVIIADGSGNQRVVVDSSGNVGLNNGTSTTQATSVIRSLGTNSGIALVPNGTGAITANIPDGTATGGNARGANAVDLQSVRGLNTEVAGGQAVIVGGAFNTAAGTQAVVVGGGSNRANTIQSFIVGGSSNSILTAGECAIVGGTLNTNNGVYGFIGAGLQNTVSVAYGVVSGGQSNTASTNTHATVVGGQSNVSSGQNSISGGNQNTASGGISVAFGDRVVASGSGAICMGGTAGIGSASTSSGLYSVSIGSNNIASADFSSAFGVASKAYLYGQQSLGSRVFGQTNYPSGDGQQSLLTASRESNLTSGDTTILSLDGTGTTNFIIPTTNRVWNVKVSTVAVVLQITGTATGVTVGDSFLENRSLLLKRVSSTSSIVGVGTVEIISDTSMSTALMAYSVGASQQLQLTFNAPTFAGGGSLSIRVVSKIELVECQFG